MGKHPRPSAYVYAIVHLFPYHSVQPKRPTDFDFTWAFFGWFRLGMVLVVRYGPALASLGLAAR